MKSSKHIALFIIGQFFAQKMFPQDFLKTYFNGNKDSLVIEAKKLIALPPPTFKTKVLFKSDNDSVVHGDNMCKVMNQAFIAKDKRKINAYKFPKKSLTTIILIHGVKSEATDYLKTASMLHDATNAEVYAIDLRGHGKSDGQKGDVDYINQYADDINDIVTVIRKSKPKGKIILAGHSMGGGILLRYAMSNYTGKIEGLILFAPLIGHNSPAFQKTPTTQNDTTEPSMKIHYARIVGLKMLNEINEHQLDSLPVLFFNTSKNQAPNSYSYRANISMAPEDYTAGLKAVNVPMIVLLGGNDEAFNAISQQKAITTNSQAEVQIIESATHKSILQDTRALQAVSKWFSALK
jgi:alpha-beta hydrolase superfamily lysophospholipase